MYSVILTELLMRAYMLAKTAIDVLHPVEAAMYLAYVRVCVRCFARRTVNVRMSP